MSNVVMKINGVDMSDVLLRHGAWSLNKRWSAETFTFTVRNSVFGPEAYRVPIGASVLLHYRGDLMFGGQVQTVQEYRAGNEGPIFVDVNCIGWDLLAHQIILTGDVGEGRLRDIAFDFYTKYLAPKGCTWLEPLNLSPIVEKMTYVRASLGEIFSRMTKMSNWPWRINGDKWFAFVEPGTLPLPMNPMRTDHFIAGLKIDQKYHEYGNRLIMQTGGTGEAKHSETRTANGVNKYFMLNVEPRPDETKTDEAGVETIVTYVPQRFKLNGVDTVFNGTPWSWDRVNHAAWTSGPPPAAGSILKFDFDISFPAVVRVWDNAMLLPDGTMNPALRIDKLLDVSHLTDVAETAAWGRVELIRAGLTPRKITGSTTIRGHYPYLTGRIALPEHSTDATFLLENVAIRDSDADPNVFEHLIYDLDFIEGDRAGRHWEDLFTEMGGRGTQGGSIEVRGTGGSVNPSVPGGSTAPPGGGGVGLPAGFTFPLGGDNNEYITLDTTFRDIPEMLPMKFGGADMGTPWTFRAFAYILGTAGPVVEIELFAGGQISVGTITTVGVLTVGPWGTFNQPVTVPGAPVDMLCRARVVTGTANVVIGHCVLYKG